MTKSLSNQVALIAGGTGALGRSASLAFLSAGATTLVTYRKQEEFDKLKSAAAANASNLHGHILDVTNESAAEQLVQKILAQHTRLDCLVNCVGGYHAGKNLWEMDSKTLDQMLLMNLRSGYVLARVVIPTMLKQNRGAIVNVASKAAIAPSAGAAAYNASKAAAVTLFDTLSLELQNTNVRVNSVLPSIINTPDTRKAVPNADHAKWPQPQDIANVILYLCSDEAKAIRGANIQV